MHLAEAPQGISTIHFLVRVIFGFGARNSLALELSTFNCSRPLVVSDHGVANAGLLDIVSPLLPHKFDCFLDSAVNPSETSAVNGANHYRQGQHDAIIGIGGGAAMDLAKAIAILVNNPAPLWNYSNRNQAPKNYRDIPPLWLMPTTAGTGSEVGRSAVIVFDNGIKAGIRCPDIVQAAICDPELCISLPAYMTAATGLDAISHAVESFCSPAINPPADAIAADSLLRLLRYLPAAFIDGSNRSARWHCLMGSMQAALAFQKGLGSVHALAHSLGVLGFHHGSLNAILLPHVLRRNRESIGHKWDQLSEIFDQACNFEHWTEFNRQRQNIAKMSTQDPASCLDSLNLMLKLPQRLSALGVEKICLPDVAAAAMRDQAHRSNPKSMTREEYLQLLEQAF